MSRGQKDRAVYVVEPGVMEIRPVDKPDIEPDEVLLQMETVGICKSDVDYLRLGRVGSFQLDGPMILGHEGSATVVQVGENVCSLKEGDRVAVEPGVPCRFCCHCKRGAYNLCAEMRFCATPPFDGFLRQYFAHPADFCFKLPDCLDFEDGALIEPLAVAVHACERARITVASTVMIFGCGPIGLLCLQVARALGAKSIMISDHRPYRLEKAKCMGADMVLEVQDSTPTKCYGDQILKNLGEPNSCIDTTGTVTCAQAGLNVCFPGGVVVLVTSSVEPKNLITDRITWKQVDLVGILRYRNNYKTAIELVRSGMVNVKDLVTHRFDLDQSEEAFATTYNFDLEPIKILINCNTSSGSDGCKCDDNKKKKPLRKC